MPIQAECQCNYKNQNKIEKHAQMKRELRVFPNTDFNTNRNPIQTRRYRGLDRITVTI